MPFQLTSNKINYCNWYSLNWLQENSFDKVNSFSKSEINYILHYQSYWINTLHYFHTFATSKNYFYIDPLYIKKNLNDLMDKKYIPKNSAEFITSLTSNSNNNKIDNDKYLINEDDICKCIWLNEARQKYKETN